MKRLLTISLLITAIIAGTAANAQTGRTISLNGQWQAAVSRTRPADYPLSVPVPGVMSSAEPDCGIDFDATTLKDDVGFDYIWYTTEFDLSDANDGYDNSNYTRALLRIRAKYNALVILNGVEIGYDAHCTYSHAEFDVTELVHAGENQITVLVIKWSDASFLEDQDHWWHAGIVRSVYLYSTGKTHICDVHATATLDDTFENGLLKVDMQTGHPEKIDPENAPFLAVRVYDENDTLVFEQKQNCGKHPALEWGTADYRRIHTGLSGMIEKVHPWSAEIPSLYTLTVTLYDKKGKEQQRLKGRCRELMVGANQDITFMKMGWELLS